MIKQLYCLLQAKTNTEDNREKKSKRIRKKLERLKNQKRIRENKKIL